MADASERLEHYRRAVAGFDAVYAAMGDRAGAPSPCEGWTASDVVEHVTGIHRTLAAGLGHTVADGASWPEARDVVAGGLAEEGALEKTFQLPFGPGAEVPVGRFLPMLTSDVLVHTWDVARATGGPEALDEQLCGLTYERAARNEEAFRSSGMFGPRVPVPDDADAQSKLLAFMGRDPA